MSDYFDSRAADWDSRPVPTQISEGVYAALREQIDLDAASVVMDFGAGTGLVSGKIAPHVERILAVDVSEKMLEQLAAKEALKGKVEIRCQDILEAPLEERVNLIVSAMAMHHVEDTAAILRAWNAHLAPGGQIAIADLDTEPGTFHPADADGVFHHGFDRDALVPLVEAAGFTTPKFVTAVEVQRDAGGSYPVFLMTATKQS